MVGIFDWTEPDNVQPEPITVDIRRELPEEFCRIVEVVNGDAVRCESPSRAHQKAVHRLLTMLETAARDYMTDCLTQATPRRIGSGGHGSTRIICTAPPLYRPAARMSFAAFTSRS